MLTIYFHCPICLEHRSVEGLRVLPCGHGCCAVCFDRAFSPVDFVRCPTCRQECLHGECHPIFVEFVEPKIGSVKAVVDGIDTMDKSVKLVSVERASSKIKKVCTQLEPDNDLATELLQALANFQERIIPVFQDCERQSEEISTLKNELRSVRQEKARLHNESQRLQAESKELRKTRSDIKTMKAERDQALKLAESAAQETLSLRQTNAVLAARDQESGNSLRELKTKLEKHIRASERSRAKLQQLSDENLLLKDQLASARSDYDLAKFEAESQKDPLPLPPSSRQLQPLSINFRDFDGMPQPGFGSDWRGDNGLKRKGSESSLFAIRLDGKGHPVRTVQLGPKRLRRVAPA